MSVMDLAGGVRGLTCDCVFRALEMLYIVSALTPADGLALIFRGKKRMLQALMRRENMKRLLEGISF